MLFVDLMGRNLVFELKTLFLAERQTHFGLMKLEQMKVLQIVTRFLKFLTKVQQFPGNRDENGSYGKFF